eukprot:TRINITY_DN6236_c0_g3_i1.p1 TRINITY_DN6236_c0_g3~~TRINITY_DN6236_c0_g3_i1.p1  ORF type:complete len:497 (+),score=141.95 TRINITY_DN6236_c0_g3_i1:3-1493(+)
MPKSSAKAFKTIIHYRSNPQNHLPDQSSHKSNTAAEREVKTDKSDIEAIKTVIEKMALKISQLEQQQESSSVCALKRFNELNNQVQGSLQSSDAFYDRLKEDELKNLRSQMFAFKDAQQKEMGEMQIALNFLNDRMLGKLSDLEAATVKAAEYNNSNMNSLDNSFKSFKYDTEHHFQNIERAIKEISSFRHADLLDNLLKIVQGQIEETVDDMIKSGVLEYARAKEEEDYRRFALVDQRMLELENDRDQIVREVEASRLDIKAAARKDASADTKLKELEDTVTSVLAEARSLKTMTEADQKAQGNMVQEYWQKMQNEISSLQTAQDQEVAKLNSRVRESTGSVLAINEQISKLRNKLNESIDSAFESIAANKNAVKSEIDDIRERLVELKEQVKDNRDSGLRIASKEYRHEPSNDDLRKKILEDAKELFKADIENIYMELGEIRIKLMKESAPEEKDPKEGVATPKEDMETPYDAYFDEPSKEQNDLGDTPGVPYI